MLVHSVYFWLKPGLTPADLHRFEMDANAMADIPGVEHLWVGKPAGAADRPVIDSSYSYALVVVFRDMDAHDLYQKHPVHDAFRKNSEMWSQVKIYDSI